MIKEIRKKRNLKAKKHNMQKGKKKKRKVERITGIMQEKRGVSGFAVCLFILKNIHICCKRSPLVVNTIIQGFSRKNRTI